MKVDIRTPDGRMRPFSEASKRFEHKLARWVKRLNKPDEQSQLLMRLLLECVGTFRMLEEHEDMNTRLMCGRAANLAMRKLAKAMKKESW